MSQITVEKTAEDSASKSLRVTVPVDRVREAEAKALQVLRPAGPAAGVPPGQGARRPWSASGSATPSARRCSKRSSARAGRPPRPPSRSSRSPIRRSATSSSKTAARSSSSCWSRSGPSSSWSGRAASGSSAGWPPVTDAAVEEQLARLQEQKAAWIPVEGAQARARARWSGSRSRRSRDGEPGAAQPYDLVLGQNQAIPELEERIMTLLPGRERRQPRSVSRRPSRTSPAGARPGGSGSRCTR